MLTGFYVSKAIYASVIIALCTPEAILRKKFVTNQRNKLPVGKKISIIVNGPGFDPSRLTDDSVALAVNQFCLTEHFGTIRPSLYMLLDPRYADPSEENESFSNAVVALNNNTSWPVMLLVPSRFVNSIQSRITNSSISIAGYPTTPFPACELPTRMRPLVYRTGWMTPPASNVLVHAIYMALLLDFEKIELHGANMNFFKSVDLDSRGRAIFLRKHFYGEEEVPLRMSMSQFFQEQFQSFSSFNDLSIVAAQKKVSIVNLTAGSLIDTFPSVKP